MSGFCRRFAGNKGAMIGVFMLVLVIAAAATAPVFFPNSPWDMVGPPFHPPFAGQQLLGTDTLGRDVLADIMYGARVSLMIGAVSTLGAIVVGVGIGAIAGYLGGAVDDALMRFTEFFQTIPTFVLAVVLVAIFRPSIVSVVAAIAIVSWPPVARVVRSEFLSLRNREFVQAAVVTGLSTRRIVLVEILPNALSAVVVLASLMIGTAILTESAISFLGLGDPNVMTWGYMIGASRDVMRRAWWFSVFPGVALVFTVLAINLVGEGLSDALNPWLNAADRR